MLSTFPFLVHFFPTQRPLALFLSLFLSPKVRLVHSKLFQDSRSWKRFQKWKYIQVDALGLKEERDSEDESRSQDLKIEAHETCARVCLRILYMRRLYTFCCSTKFFPFDNGLFRIADSRMRLTFLFIVLYSCIFEQLSRVGGYVDNLPECNTRKGGSTASEEAKQNLLRK